MDFNKEKKQKDHFFSSNTESFGDSTNADQEREVCEDYQASGKVRVSTQKEGSMELIQKEGDPFFVELVKIVLVSLLIIVPIRTFIFQPFFVQGASMEPNFHEGEYLIVNELGYKKTVLSAGKSDLLTVKPFKEFDRGDAVVFKYPLNPSKYFIKRIVGLPGETIEIKNGKVFIYNSDFPEGFELKESNYLPAYVETSGEEKFVLGDDEYVVLGDNRSHSSDSRAWGSLNEEFIIGRVLLRAWPLNNFSIF